MYAYIKGTLTDISPDFATVEVNGFGYLVHIPLNFFASAPPLGEIITLYTELIVREDSMRIFGFAKKEDKELYKALSSLSGIGPKTALNIIGHLDQINLPQVIANKETKPLERIPGIGKKMAERLIFELASHSAKFSLQNKNISSLPNDLLQDATSALLNLGYSEAKASLAIQKVLNKEKAPKLPQLITSALQYL